MDLLIPQSTIQRRKFHLIVVSVGTYDLKSPKMETNTEKTVFYKQVLDFHRPYKILCRTSGRQNTGT